MSLRLFNVILGCAVGLLVADAALAQPRIQPPGQQQPPAQPPGGGGGGGGGGNMIRGTNAELTAKALTAAGYQSVEIITINDNKHVQAKVNDVTMRAIHYGCENNSCTSLQFFTTFGRQQQIDLNYVNSWNQEKRFAKLYLEKNGTLSFDMDIHFYGGTTPDYISQSGVLFGHMLKILFEFKPAAN